MILFVNLKKYKNRIEKVEKEMLRLEKNYKNESDLKSKHLRLESFFKIDIFDRKNFITANSC